MFFQFRAFEKFCVCFERCVEYAEEVLEMVGVEQAEPAMESADVNSAHVVRSASLFKLVGGDGNVMLAR